MPCPRSRSTRPRTLERKPSMAEYQRTRRRSTSDSPTMRSTKATSPPSTTISVRDPVQAVHGGWAFCLALRSMSSSEP
ncbi:hypothetical protein CDD83_5045 [Cordyceps sp. RAO-2017]|nr:hypothetical protein CDD83_5045 [Cordyceps sp. RAO-2017]